MIGATSWYDGLRYRRAQERVCLTLVLYPYIMVEYGAEPDSVNGDSALKVGQSDPVR